MRDKVAEKVMLAEVHFRNVIAKCVHLNREEHRIAAIPEVGIFWMSKDGKLFFKKSVPVKDAETYGDFKILDTPHYDVWNQAKRSIPSWGRKEYEEVPRGRVVMHVEPGNNSFIVYLPKELKKHERRILREFLLPGSLTEFDYSDVHYRMDHGFDQEEW